MLPEVLRPGALLGGRPACTLGPDTTLLGRPACTLEGAAAEVKDDDVTLRGSLLLIESVGDSGGGVLVDDPEDGEAGDDTSVVGGLALGEVEVEDFLRLQLGQGAGLYDSEGPVPPIGLGCGVGALPAAQPKMVLEESALWE